MERDILYYIGNGSKWDNNEFRYSLRSIEKYATGYGKLFVVGYCPDFIKPDGGYISHPDGDVVFHNAIEKICTAVEQFEDMSDDFLVMMDDVFICKNIDFSDYGYYIRGNHLRTKSTNKWGRNINATGNMLRGLGLKDRNYEEHSPFLLNKDRWNQMNDIFAFQCELACGLSWRSMYGNRYKVGGESMSDMKIRGSYVEENGGIDNVMDDLLKDRHCFSIDDTCLKVGMSEWLETKFSDKSKWEID